MAELANAIAQLRANEIAQAESSLASCFPPPPKVTPETHQRLIPFLQWCEQQRVRAVPARPTTVAAFVVYNQDQGVSRQLIAERLEAIEIAHEAASVGNPTASSVVRTVTGGSTIEPPRSWTGDERQQLWPQLPPEIQAVIARREKNRETELRRAQNEAADLRNEIKRLTVAAASTHAADNTTTEKETTNE